MWLCYLQWERSEGAETVRFNYYKVLTHIIATHGLANIGTEQRPLRMVQSIVGARLTTRVSHVIGGLKIHDHHATIYPINKNVFLLTGESARAQSWDLCFPMHLMLGKETGETFQGEFKPMFTFFENTRKNGLKGLTDLKPLTITTKVDMSAAWTGLGRGGGAKVHNYLCCHCCSIHSDKLHHPKTNCCDCWCLLGLHQDKPVGWRCYHNDIVTDEALSSVEVEMSELLEGLENNMQNVLDATSQLTFIWRQVLVPRNKLITEHNVIRELCALSFLLWNLNNTSHIATRSFEWPPFFRRCKPALFYFTFCMRTIDNSSTYQMLLHSNHIWLSDHILYGNNHNYSMETLLMPLQTLCSLVYNMYTEA